MTAICDYMPLNNIGDAVGGIAVFAAMCAAALLIALLAARVSPRLLFGSRGDGDRLGQVRVWCDDRLADPLLRAELLAVLDGPDGAP
jgi:hypothetical protein